MTRINVVPVKELSDAHLALEHYELHRVYVLVRKAILRGEQPDLTAVPEYTMGKRHVRFFYPRLAYIKQRETELIVEMLFRGLTLIREEEVIIDIPSSWFGSYVPDNQALQINRTRIAIRTMEYERLFTRGYFTA